MTTPTNGTADTSLEEEKNDAIRINVNVNSRMFTLPALGALTGLTLGLIRGSREAKLQFVAENVHRQPRTVGGWYFYNKTKNYRMMLAGLRAGGRDAVMVGSVGLAWAGIEEGIAQFVPALEPGKELFAGIGTAATFGAVTRLGVRRGWKAVVLGGVAGGVLSGLRVFQAPLEDRIRRQSQEPSR